MLKRIVISALVLLTLAGGIVGIAQAQDPTIPTRTPTPDPNRPPPNPTATSDGSDDGGGQPPPPPAATETAAPGTATVGPTATLPGAGPLPGGQTPGQGPATGQSGSIVVPGRAAGSCDETPYARALQRITVYAGPGTDYPVSGTLEPGEMRPIVGRAAFAMWWQIMLEPGVTGWVSDGDVSESGNTAIVPVAAPPLINGLTPTPGALWNPTPLPLLTCVPTPIPSATPTASATPEAGSDAVGSPAPPGSSENLPSAPDANVANVGATTGQEIPAGPGVSSRGTEAGRAASPTSMTNLILPIAGIVLIGAGIALALLSRSRGSTNRTD